MDITNDNHNSRNNDLEWRLLGEYPLNELKVGIDTQNCTNAGLLFQTISDMGLHPDLLSNIENKLIGFADEAMPHLDQEGSELPLRIRIFCHEKTVEDVNSTVYPSFLNPEKSIKSNQIIHQTEAEINGGWGYFLIKRGSFPPGSLVSTGFWIDLYLYKEGE